MTCLNADTVTEERSSDRKLILVLFGSPRKNGYTAKLLNEFLSPFGENVQIRVVHAYDSGIRPCTACDVCCRSERCSQSDFDELDSLIRCADVLVVATPVYVLSFPAPLKAVVDRMQRYFSARFSLGINPPIAKHRTAALLVTNGSASREGAQVMARQLKMVFSVMNTTLCGEAVWTGTDFDSGRSTFDRARREARDLALAIKSEL